MEKLFELKAIVTVLGVLSATLLVAFGKIGDGVYATVMVGAIGGFLAAQTLTEKPAAKAAE